MLVIPNHQISTWQFNNVIRCLIPRLIVFSIGYLVRMRLELKPQPAGDESFKKLKQRINMIVIVLQWQKELAEFLDRVHELIKSLIVGFDIEDSRMLQKDSDSDFREISQDGMDIVSADDYEDIEEQFYREIEEFEELLRENVELLRKTLDDTRQIGMGYAFLIKKEEANIKQVENDIRHEKMEEMRVSVLLNTKWRLPLPGLKTKKAEADRQKTKDQKVVVKKNAIQGVFENAKANKIFIKELSAEHQDCSEKNIQENEAVLERQITANGNTIGKQQAGKNILVEQQNLADDNQSGQQSIDIDNLLAKQNTANPMLAENQNTANYALEGEKSAANQTELGVENHTQCEQQKISNHIGKPSITSQNLLEGKGTADENLLENDGVRNQNLLENYSPENEELPENYNPGNEELIENNNSGNEKLPEKNSKKAAKLEKYSMKQNRQRMEIERVTESILMLDCIRLRQLKQLQVVQKLIGYMEARIYDRNNILSSLVDNNNTVCSDINGYGMGVLQNSTVDTNMGNDSNEEIFINLGELGLRVPQIITTYADEEGKGINGDQFIMTEKYGTYIPQNINSYANLINEGINKDSFTKVDQHGLPAPYNTVIPTEDINIYPINDVIKSGERHDLNIPQNTMVTLEETNNNDSMNADTRLKNAEKHGPAVPQTPIVYTDETSNDSINLDSSGEFEDSSIENSFIDIENLNQHCLEFIDDDLCDDYNFRKAFCKWACKILPGQPVMNIPIADYPVVKSAGNNKNAPRALGRLRKAKGFRFNNEILHQTISVAV